MNKNISYIVSTALIVALGGFLMGFDASVISGVNKFIELEFSLTKLEVGWAVSSLTLTATLAMLVAGPLSDKLGRRQVLKYAAILYALSAILSAIAPSFIALVLARMLGGLGVGASLIIAPMYIAEISPAAIRGRMVSFNQLNIVLGISVAFFTNYLILQLGSSDASWAQTLNFDKWNWRWMLGIEAIPAVLYFLGLFFVPRSPRWLVMKGEFDEALEVMSKATGPQVANQEMSEIQKAIASDTGKKTAPLSELFKKSMTLVLTIGIVIGVLQQITGINSVFFYAPMIFEQSGIGTDASFSQAIYVGLINLVFTLIAIALIDKLGRKPLLVGGMAGIVICMFLLAYSFNSATYTLTETAVTSLPAEINKDALATMIGTTFDNDLDYKASLSAAIGDAAGTYESDLLKGAININPTMVLLGILGFVASFAVSIGPVMWVLFSELFPNKVRALAISFVGLINSAVSFLVQLVFPWELATLGTGTTFMIYGVFGLIGLIFILMVVPETKGKSLEELERQLVK
ncbi:MAG: sugar porter family MFS transporter [Lewinella sp.]|jgi:sugar porter (SP) family MFS transporter|uniref:sugar porter family MFS transporter n=1 Tax=Lewinella sp. TaxID=2004506 RepID=UPI003D6AF4CB